MEFNIADLFESVVDAIPERAALVSGERRLSFAELDRRANRLAHFLAARGIGPGSHIGLHLYNGSEYVEGFLAACKLRAGSINLNYRYVAGELRYLCENAELALVISQRELGAVAAEAVAGVDGLHTLLLVDDGSDAAWPVLAPRPGDSVGVRCLAYEDCLAAGSDQRGFAPRSGDDHYILYTGGTTGMPRGVVWRHEDVFFGGLQGGNPGGEPIAAPEELADIARDPDNAMNILPTPPFIHGAGIWSALISMFTGGKVVLQPGRSFDARRVCELIAAEQVSTVTLIGDAMARPIADVLAAPGKGFDMSSLVVIASAGAVLSPAVQAELQRMLPDCMILNNFGSSETGHQGAAFPGSESGQDGRPSFAMGEGNTVLDDDLRPIEPGSGKIGRVARTGHIPLGYYKDPDKTRERFVEVDGVRWVLPGDYATIEEDGRITVFGRGANCINTGGEKVYPEEVEEVLKAHPDIFDALVVGLDDAHWMQRVVAVVAPRPGKPLTLEQVQAHCHQHIAGYKVPRQLVVVEQIERLPTGKPDYPWARKTAESA